MIKVESKSFFYFINFQLDKLDELITYPIILTIKHLYVTILLILKRYQTLTK